MWSTCLFTTITSQEKLKRLQSWWQDSTVQPHTAVWSAMKMSSCPAVLVPVHTGTAAEPRAFQAGTPRSGCSRQSCPFLQLWVEQAPRTERLPCNQGRGGRKPKVGARCAPAASPATALLLLHCSSSQGRGTRWQEHCRWWQWGERLERVAGHRSHQVSLGTAYRAVQPPHQGCQPVGCQQRKSFHA